MTNALLSKALFTFPTSSKVSLALGRKKKGEKNNKKN